jgi:hypothetical protein
MKFVVFVIFSLLSNVSIEETHGDELAISRK